MGRPLSPKLVLRGDHYAFRCVVKDGGRPWIALPPGLTIAEAQATALVIAQKASVGGYSFKAGPKKTKPTTPRADSSAATASPRRRSPRRKPAATTILLATASTASAMQAMLTA